MVEFDRTFWLLSALKVINAHSCRQMVLYILFLCRKIDFNHLVSTLSHVFQGSYLILNLRAVGQECETEQTWKKTLENQVLSESDDSSGGNSVTTRLLYSREVIP